MLEKRHLARTSGLRERRATLPSYPTAGRIYAAASTGGACAEGEEVGIRQTSVTRASWIKIAFAPRSGLHCRPIVRVGTTFTNPVTSRSAVVRGAQKKSRALLAEKTGDTMLIVEECS
jgi:hypothetical protein